MKIYNKNTYIEIFEVFCSVYLHPNEIYVMWFGAQPTGVSGCPRNWIAV